VCLDCGCGDYPNCHGDIRHVSLVNITGAVDANDGDLTLAEVVQNIKDGLDDILAGNDGATGEVSTKSLRVHSHDGAYHVHISVDPE
jgi:hypothetical protein